MKEVFADTLYWVAVLRPNDPYSDRTRLVKAKPTRLSMNAMRGRGIREILTDNRHFAQEGFTPLL